MTPLMKHFKTKQKLIYGIAGQDNGYPWGFVSGRVHKGGFWAAGDAFSWSGGGLS